MTKSEAMSLLRKENPLVPFEQLRLYADVFMTYQEAQRNLDDNGSVVAHPRTGEPFDNPYLKIRVQALETLRKIGETIFTNVLWEE